MCTNFSFFWEKQRSWTKWHTIFIDSNTDFWPKYEKVLRSSRLQRVRGLSGHTQSPSLINDELGVLKETFYGLKRVNCRLPSLFVSFWCPANKHSVSQGRLQFLNLRENGHHFATHPSYASLQRKALLWHLLVNVLSRIHRNKMKVWYT